MYADLKRVASEIGHKPSRREYLERGKYTKEQVERFFGLWSEFLKAANAFKEKCPDFKYKKSLIESFVVHEVNLNLLFEKAGNPKSLKCILMPDTHLEHVDEQALKVFLKFAEFYDPHIFIILGDFLDASGISHWPSDSLKPRRFIPEVIKGRELLSLIKQKTPDCVYYAYCEGNHEDWIRQALVAKLPELFDGIDELGLYPSLEKLLDLEKFGIDLIPLNEFLKIGSAHITHGLYVGDGHAKKHLNKIKGTVFYGHLHDTNECIDTSINGVMVAKSCGCLSKLNAPFLRGRMNNWVHAFQVLEFFPDGTFTYFTPNIKNGKLSFMGKVFE